MDELLIKNVRALEPGQGIVGSWVHVRNGKIASYDSDDKACPTCPQTIDGGSRLLTPGLIDMHTHGIERFCYEAGAEALSEASRRLARYGTTCVLPTLYKIADRQSMKDLEKLTADLTSVKDVSMPGFHLEGPFLALAGAGAKTVSGDLGLLDELLWAGGGWILAMSISPETPDILPVIERLVECGIAPLITHTAATVEQTQRAVDAGARHATHFYDVFPPPVETEPGVRPSGAVEAILGNPRCSVDFIGDGVHVHPAAIQAALAAKGWERIILITDSNVGAGLPPGVYDSPVGGKLRVAPDGGARVHRPGSPINGSLSGSTLTMDRGMSNMLDWLDLPEAEAWALGTCNPARLLGLSDKGTLRGGADADLVLWEQSVGALKAVVTWVAGRCVFQQQ